MHLTYRNPSWAFRSLVQAVWDGSIPTERRQSRNGMTITIPEPVIITLTHPRERVLVNAARDCNPFFHLFESIWMLAGWNDIRPLLYFLPKYADFSDDGVTANGAYGYRWRKARCDNCDGTGFEGESECPPCDGSGRGVDQLEVLIEHLKAKPESRRAVLQMWNVEDDLLKVDKSKDVCCLAGDTKFRSPEGDLSIATLANRFHLRKGYKFPVYSVDTVTGDMRLSWMTSAWKTGIKKTLKLTLDDGSTLRLTSDHTVFRKKKLFDGKRCVGIQVTECVAGDLDVGDSLLADLAEDAKARTDGGGYRVTKRNLFRNTARGNMLKEHREYLKFVYGSVKGLDGHHKNRIRTDNRLTNLELISPTEHQRSHKIGDLNPHRQMSVEDRARRGKIHSAVMRSGGKSATPAHIREILSKRPPTRTLEESNALWDWACSLSNHKIVSIEDGGYTEVYDFNVPGRHNAVLSNGVVVHNCNLSVMFSLRDEPTGNWDAVNAYNKALDMTVVNRSNDLVWGLCGANMVHFSMLQEYIACALNVAVGHYHTMTNNLHIYTEGNSGFHPEKWLAEPVPRTPPHTSIPLFRENMRPQFDRDCVRMMRWNDPLFNPEELETIFMRDVVHPMCMAFACHKVREYGPAFAALRPMDELARDWQLDAERWLRKRQADFKAKQEAADAAHLS